MDTHDKELLFLILGFMARALAGRKIGIWEEKLFDRFVARFIDPAVRRLIIRTERSLAIWLHHQQGHPVDNVLLCETGYCVKVKPRVPEPVQYEIPPK